MIPSALSLARSVLFFFFNDTATTEIYTLSLHDALPICDLLPPGHRAGARARGRGADRDHRARAHLPGTDAVFIRRRSEEHTSELQSPCNLVCRLLLEKKKKTTYWSLICSWMTAAVSRES